MELHDLVYAFPGMSAEEFDELCVNINKNGLLQPLITYEGKIIDGRHRYNACKKLGIEPHYEEWNGTGSMVEFVYSLNLNRRHLNSSQKACLAQNILPLLEKEAKERQGERNDLKEELKDNISQKIDKGGEKTKENRATEQVAKMSKTNRQYVSDAKKLKEETPDVFDKVLNGAITMPTAKMMSQLPEEKRKNVFQEITTTKKPAQQIRKAVEEYKRETMKPVKMPVGKYSVILADPLWRYDFSKSDSRKIENQYPTMDIDEICAMKIPSTDNSILFLWGTAPKLLEAIKVMTAWGFTYKTNMVWVKDKIGMGYYVRGQHELILIGTKGTNSVPITENRPSSVLTAPRMGHSVKPKEVYAILEKMYPHGKFLEVFARDTVNNWSAYGNEIQ